MYAIVKTGGKQYRVERGQRLLVERLPAAEGETVALEPVLYRSEQAVFDKAGLAKVKVSARVIAHERGEKLRVFKFKPKRGYKRRTGHRQELTRIEVTELALGGGSTRAKASGETVAAPAKAAAKPAAPKPAKATAKPVAAQAGETKVAEVKGDAVRADEEKAAAKPVRGAKASEGKAAAKPARGAKAAAGDTKKAGAAKPAAAKAAAKKAPAKPRKTAPKEDDDGS